MADDVVSAIDFVGNDMRSALKLDSDAPLVVYLPDWLLVEMSDAEKQTLADSGYTIERHWNNDDPD